MSELLNKLYNDPSTGFQSLDKLYKKAKSIDSTITRKIVAEFLNNNRTDLLHRAKRTKKERLPIIGTVNSYQADLIFYYSFKHKNKGFAIILTAININTKYAFAIPVKTKTAADMLEAMTELVKQVKDKYGDFYTLETDNGNEFLNSKVQALLEANQISHHTGQEGDHQFTGIIERFNRTLKGLIAKYMTAKDTATWIDVLPQLVDNYNSTDHSTLEQADIRHTKPKDITKDEEKQIIDGKLVKALHAMGDANLNVGDYVLVPAQRSLFDKEGQRWSTEVYTVSKIALSKVSLNKSDGTPLRKRYRVQELQKIARPLAQITKIKHAAPAVEQAKKEAKVERILRKEGVDEGNIREPRLRERKPVNYKV